MKASRWIALAVVTVSAVIVTATALGGSSSSKAPIARVVLRPMDPGEPIMNSKISGEGGRATLSAILPVDRRAVSIRISDVAGVSGFALPGDRVDVILTHSEGPTQVADVILQDIRVIAIDQDPNDQAANPRLGRTATLEVEPFDAQKLALAAQVGTLSLALRSAKAEAGANYSARVGPGDLTGGFGGPRTAPASLPSYNPPPLRVRPLVRPAAISGRTPRRYKPCRHNPSCRWPWLRRGLAGPLRWHRR